MAAPPYSCRPSGRSRYGNFKIYYADISGRSNSAKYEWDASGLDRKLVPDALKRLGLEGTGFLVAFPHVTKVFVFDTAFETNLNVRAFATPDFSDLSLARLDGYQEFACLAEALICSGEFRLWAESADVEAYLATWTDWESVTIRNVNKL